MGVNNPHVGVKNAEIDQINPKNIFCTLVQTKVDVLLHFIEKWILNKVNTPKPLLHLLYKVC